MLTHFFKVIARFLVRKMYFTGLTVAGLSIGLASCLVIYLFVRNEMSYDKFHQHGERIFRVIRQSQINGMPYNVGVTAASFGTALAQDFPSRVEAMTRVFSFQSLVAHEDVSFIEERLLLADSNFFGFFSYPLSKGDASSVLSNGNSIVLSEELAQKYFGEEDPIGRTIRLDGEHDMMITGVMAPLPGNTHLQFDAVGSMNIIESEDWYDDWWANALFTYVRIGRPEDEQQLNLAFPEFMEKYFGADFARVGNRIGLKLEPLSEIYFNYDTRYENNVAHGDRRYIAIFGSIAALLLILAAINYINMATAQSSVRAREVGVRKTLGSGQGAIALQFLAESFLLCALSGFLAVAIAQLTIPLLNAQFGLAIPGVFDDSSVGWVLLIIVGALALASGTYPSIMLSAFRPVQVLKGQVKGDLQYIFVRKVLVIFQFGISGFMIISTLFIGKQLNFMREKDLGYQPDQLLVVDLNNERIYRERFAFITKLLTERSFLNASLTSGFPGGFYDATTVNIAGEHDNMRMRTLWTDSEYLQTMDLSLIAGRFFSKEYPADSARAVVLNETAVRQLGWTAEEALGKSVMLAQFDSVYKEVVGVVEDFHFTSLKQKIEPLIISCVTNRGNLLIRMSGEDIPAALASLQSVWDSFDSGFPMDVVFLDEVVDRLYQSERVQGKIFTLFSAISVSIACLGILGLGTYIASQRRKEIGVRKVLGATTGQVSVLLMKDLLALVLIANIIAMPVVYLAIDKWLTGFAYRVDIDPIVFVVGGGMVFLIAAIISGVNATRIASQNPVTALRSE